MCEPAARSLIDCPCGRAAVVGVMLYGMGGAITVQPLHWPGADRNAADWRCRDCIADACDLLPLSPTEAAARLSQDSA